MTNLSTQITLKRKIGLSRYVGKGIGCVIRRLRCPDWAITDELASIEHVQKMCHHIAVYSQ